MLRALGRALDRRASLSPPAAASWFSSSPSSSSPAPASPAAATAVVTQDLATRLAHAGCVVCPTTGALTPPVHPSSTFERGRDLEYPKGYVYARTGNPTRNLLEDVLADIETPLGSRPGRACAFASGVAAAHAVFQGLPGGHVVLADDVYHGNRSLLQDVFEPWGLSFTTVDMTDLDAVRSALSGALSASSSSPPASTVSPCSSSSPNVVLWAETPSNPLLKVTDIRAVSDICREAGGGRVPFVVDATWLTPWLCQPLALGADMVVHSSTKYFGGHSDLTGGVLAVGDGASPAAAALFERARLNQGACGGTPSPFDCWLTLRGLRSLSARMSVHSRNAMAVARCLERHPRVAAVHFPGLAGHPGHHVMREALTRRGRADQDNEEPMFGGMVSFQVDGGEEMAVRMVASTQIFKRATSLGGTESLIEHRRTVEDAASTTPRNLVRLSVGLESERDLVWDLEQALDTL